MLIHLRRDDQTDNQVNVRNNSKRIAFVRDSSLSRLVLLAVVANLSAWADTMVWSNPNGATWTNYYTSPYYATDTSLNPAQLMTLFCLDYNNDINPPSTWQANLNSLSASNVGQFQYGGVLSPAFTGDTPGDGHGVTMLAGSDAYHRYLEAAWLFTNILGAQTKSDANVSLISQVAAWDLFVDQNHIDDLTTKIGATSGTFTFTDYVGVQNAIDNLTFRDAVDESLNAAQTAALGGWTPLNGWIVVTGDANSNGGTPIQEFLTPVPEPVSLMLMATILLGAAFLFRKKTTRASKRS